MQSQKNKKSLQATAQVHCKMTRLKDIEREAHTPNSTSQEIGGSVLK